MKKLIAMAAGICILLSSCICEQQSTAVGSSSIPSDEFILEQKTAYSVNLIVDIDWRTGASTFHSWKNAKIIGVQYSNGKYSFDLGRSLKFYTEEGELVAISGGGIMVSNVRVEKK